MIKAVQNLLFLLVIFGKASFAYMTPYLLSTESECAYAVEISWYGSAQQGFNVYRSTTLMGTKYFIGATNSFTKTLTDATAEPNAYYNYYVEAVDYNDTSPLSSSLYVHVEAVPSTPFSPTVTDKSPEFVKLSLPFTSGVDGLCIYRSSSSLGTKTLIGTVNSYTTTFTDNTVIANNTYYYFLASFDECYRSEYSFSTMVSVPDYLQSPGKPTAELSPDYEVVVSWPLYSGEDGMKIYRAKDITTFIADSFYLQTTLTSSIATEWTDVNVLPGHTYFYIVVPYDQYGSGYRSVSSDGITIPIVKIEQDNNFARLLINPYVGWTTREGQDGRVVTYPSSGWTAQEGSDGRIVVRPSTGWTFVSGTDGRLVPKPISGWLSFSGTDGREVIYPNMGWTRSEGIDGRVVIRPILGWTTTTGSDKRIVARPTLGWTNSEGTDGRQVARPTLGWTTTTGADGRNVARPTLGWTTVSGTDKRSVAKPTLGWTSHIGGDGRAIVYPTIGWSFRTGSDLRSIPFPSSTLTEFDLTFQTAEKLAIFSELFGEINQAQLYEYILVQYLNDDEPKQGNVAALCPHANTPDVFSVSMANNTLLYTLPKNAVSTRISVYVLSGRRLFDNELPNSKPGYHSINLGKMALAKGIYCIRVAADNNRAVVRYTAK